MTAIDELCQLLDGRNEEYDIRDNSGGTASYVQVGWFFNLADRAYFYGYPDGHTKLVTYRYAYDLTPEQAVEATLGRGTCHAIDTGYATAFCSVCGAEFMGSIMTNEPPDYVKPLTRCPERGRKIVEVDE